MLSEKLIKDALKKSFMQAISDGADVPFAQTGVSMPSDKVWDRYARDVASALTPSVADPAEAVHPVGGAVVKININDIVLVKLTEAGEMLLKQNHEDFRRSVPKIGSYHPPKKDDQGRTSFQLWDLMNTFGYQLTLGSSHLPFETDIEIPALSLPQAAGETGPKQQKFALGDRVHKTKGASWQGQIVGFYRTALTPVGYAVESEREPGSVQIYPEAALSLVPPQAAGEMETAGPTAAARGDVRGSFAAFEVAHPDLYWHIAKGKISAGEPHYGAIICTDGGTEIGEGESDVSADEAFRIAIEDAGLALSPTQEGMKPYGYVVELQSRGLFITRSRVQSRIGVAKQCAAHWDSLYPGDDWNTEVVPLYDGRAALQEKEAGE